MTKSPEKTRKARDPRKPRPPILLDDLTPREEVKGGAGGTAVIFGETRKDERRNKEEKEDPESS